MEIKTEEWDLEKIKNLKPGDHYHAVRSGPCRVLTVRMNDVERGWIQPVEMAYSYDYKDISTLDQSYGKDEIKTLIEKTTTEYDAWIKKLFPRSPHRSGNGR